LDESFKQTVFHRLPMQSFSIAVLGSGGVEKTCLVLRLTKDTWDSDCHPMIASIVVSE
jgi:GTPase SAR1 family protein